MAHTHVHKNILEAIGNTPIVRLNSLAKALPCDVYVKCEFMNPGGSIKDRIGLWMIEDAEKKGLLKPGGTIVECTSGNTGFGLALAAAIKGYPCIFVLPDKMSEEKIRALRAFGAKVVVTPTAVHPDDPRSYTETAKRIARETPGAWCPDQYNNLSNREAHKTRTGPEILEQMPDVDFIFAGIGTGGTVCGIGMHMKSAKPSVKMVAVDPVGSIVYDKFKFNKDVEAHPYKVEGIGEDFFPKNYDFSVLHDMVQVGDKDSFVMTRALLTHEGIYSGTSSGAAVFGALQWLREQGDKVKGKKALVILPDSGNRYLSKCYDDEWMRENGYLDVPGLGRVSDLMRVLKISSEKLIKIAQNEKVSTAIDLMKEKGISQIPVLDAQQWVKGVVTEAFLLKALYTGRIQLNQTLETLVDPSVEYVSPDDSIEKISKLVTAGKTPLITQGDRLLGIITKIDLLTFIGART